MVTLCSSRLSALQWLVLFLDKERKEYIFSPYSYHLLVQKSARIDENIYKDDVSMRAALTLSFFPTLRYIFQYGKNLNLNLKSTLSYAALLPSH